MSDKEYLILYLTNTFTAYAPPPLVM